MLSEEAKPGYSYLFVHLVTSLLLLLLEALSTYGFYLLPVNRRWFPAGAHGTAFLPCLCTRDVFPLILEQKVALSAGIFSLDLNTHRYCAKRGFSMLNDYMACV